MKTILKYSGSAWLGGSLGVFSGLHFYNWQWWAIALPTIVLIRLFSHEY